MASWFDRYVWRRQPERQITSIDSYVAALNEFFFNGVGYLATGNGLQQTQNGQPTEQITNDLRGYASAAYAANGVVFACMAVRMMVMASGVRFTFQRFNKGTPSDFFSRPDLDLLHEPWVGGTVQDLLVRTIQDADLAGNAYWTRQGNELVRLRPDWVQIVLEPRMVLRAGMAEPGPLGYRRLGYLYTEGGSVSEHEPVPLLPSEVVHFAPYPDPLASYRGMSWLTPIARELQADGQMTRHKARYFENAATPNMVVHAPEGVKEEAFKKFVAEFNAGHKGFEHAYKTLFLAAGADATVVGNSMQQMDFRSVQAIGETRICAAARVHPTIVGVDSGLQGSSLNAGNFGAARRLLVDGTAHPLWGNIAGSFSVLVPGPPGARLWYDSRNVAILREDEKDAAEIQLIRAQVYRQLVDTGWTPESVKAYMLSGDESLLTHSGLYSVQLQPAGTVASANGNGQVPVLSSN